MNQMVDLIIAALGKKNRHLTGYIILALLTLNSNSFDLTNINNVYEIVLMASYQVFLYQVGYFFIKLLSVFM